MELKHRRPKKKILKGKVTFRCLQEQEDEVKLYGDIFDFNDWFRECLEEGLRRAKNSGKSAS